MKKRIAILGSTGSIGTQALEVIREQQDFFGVEVLSANNNSDLLISQAIEFRPNAVVIGADHLYQKVSTALDPYHIKVYAGEAALCQILEMETIDMVLIALVGYAGLKPTLCAIEAGRQIAIANKETFVVAGELVTRRAREKGVNLFPVDSNIRQSFHVCPVSCTIRLRKYILRLQADLSVAGIWSFCVL